MYPFLDGLRGSVINNYNDTIGPANNTYYYGKNEYSEYSSSDNYFSFSHFNHLDYQSKDAVYDYPDSSTVAGAVGVPSNGSVNDLNNPTNHPRLKVQHSKYPAKIKAPVQSVYCEVCQCTLNSISQAEFHFRGQNHQKKMVTQQQQNLSSGEQNSTTTTATTTVVGNTCTTTNSCSSQTVLILVSDSQISPPASNEPDAAEGESEGAARGESPPRKKKKLIATIPCDVCNTTFNSEGQAEDHFKGGRHLKKLKQLQNNLLDSGSTPDNKELTLQYVASNRSRYRCYLCNISLNSSVQYDQHCSGHSHTSKLMSSSSTSNKVKGNKGGWFYCSTCDISCQTALGLQRHVSSDEHKSNVRAKNTSVEIIPVFL